MVLHTCGPACLWTLLTVVVAFLLGNYRKQIWKALRKASKVYRYSFVQKVPQALFGQQQVASTDAVGLLLGCLDHSSKTKQLFTNGTYMLVDPGHVMFEMLVASPASYARSSSHLVKIPPKQPQQWGLDTPTIVWRVGKEEVRARTLLFCKLVLNGTPLLFLKPEGYGLGTPYGILMHGWDYILTRPLVTKIIGKGLELTRKERILPIFASSFVKEATDLGLDAKLAKRVSKEGVYAMLAALDRFKAGDEAQKRFKGVVAKALGYEEDHRTTELNYQHRIGAEVYIDDAASQQMLQRLKLLSPLEGNAMTVSPRATQRVLRDSTDTFTSWVDLLPSPSAMEAGATADELLLKVVLGSSQGTAQLAVYLKEAQAAGTDVPGILDAARQGDATRPEFLQLRGHMEGFAHSPEAAGCMG